MSIVSIFSSFLKHISLPTNKKLLTSPTLPILMMKVLNETTSLLILRLICQNLKITENLENINAQLKDLKKLFIIEKQGDLICLSKYFRISILKFTNQKFQTKIKPIESCKRKNINIFNEILRQFVENSGITKNIFDLFFNANLITKTGNITSQGFDFLLKSNKEQLWILIFEILKNIKAERDDCIEFVFELFICKPNYKYCISYAHEYILLLNYLAELGLLYYEIKDNTINIEITELAGNLIETNIEKEKFIIVETNYKFYAYTTHKHQISILKLFCSNIKFLSDFIVGEINEFSVKKAFEKGISAFQITNFLDSHSKHICFTIKEQIQIWEAKDKRFNYTKSVMLTNFKNFDQFNEVIGFCEEMNALLFVDKNQEIIVLKAKCYEELKKKIKRA